MQIIAIPKNYRPGDYERIPFATTAVVALTASKFLDASGNSVKAVLIIIEGATARWRDDGGSPVTGATGDGSPWTAGTMMTLNGLHSIRESKWIGSSTSGAIHAHYYY